MAETSVRANHAWRTAWAAGMVSYLDAGALITIGIAMVLYQDELSVDPGMQGVVQATLTLALALGALVGGRLGDRFGRRRVITITIVMYILAVGVLALTPVAWVLYPAAVVLGLAIGADLPVSLALINEEAPAGRKGRMVAFSVLLWFIGIIVPNILTAILGPLGTLAGRILFLHLFVVGILVLLLRTTIRESVEWAAARRLEVEDPERIRFSHAGQLLRPPLLLTVAALGLYYAMWGLGANTMSAFGTLAYTEAAGGTAQEWSLVILIALPLGIAGGLIMMKIADAPVRRHFVNIAGVLFLVAFLVPAIFGVTGPTLIAAWLLFGTSAAFFGESIYKLWVQETVPTLLRSTAQGLTLTIHRVVTALFALVTPALITAEPRMLFILLSGAGLIAVVVCYVWVPRLPRATVLETPAVLVTDRSVGEPGDVVRP